MPRTAIGATVLVMAALESHTDGQVVVVAAAAAAVPVADQTNCRDGAGVVDAQPVAGDAVSRDTQGTQEAVPRARTPGIAIPSRPL